MRSSIGVLFLALVLVPALGFLQGCTYSAEGVRSDAYGFMSNNTLTIVNNTRYEIDVQCGRGTLVKNLATGQTFARPLVSFYDGEEVTLIAIGHTKGNEGNGGEYVGSSIRREWLSSGYNGGRRRSIVWVVDHLDPPR